MDQMIAIFGEIRNMIGGGWDRLTRIPKLIGLLFLLTLGFKFIIGVPFSFTVFVLGVAGLFTMMNHAMTVQNATPRLKSFVNVGMGLAVLVSILFMIGWGTGLSQASSNRSLRTLFSVAQTIDAPDVEAESHLMEHRRERRAQLDEQLGKALAAARKMLQSGKALSEVEEAEQAAWKAYEEGTSTLDQLGNSGSSWWSSWRGLTPNKPHPPREVPANATRWELDKGQSIWFDTPQEFHSIDKRKFYVWDRKGKRYTIPDDGPKLQGKMADGRHRYEGGPNGNIIWTWPS